MSFVFVYVPKPRFVIAGSSVANCKTRKINRYSDIMYEALRIIYKALLYSVPEITGMKCGKKQRKQGIISFLSISVKFLFYR